MLYVFLADAEYAAHIAHTHGCMFGAKYVENLNVCFIKILMGLLT